jgi:hypothetical protein
LKQSSVSDAVSITQRAYPSPYDAKEFISVSEPTDLIRAQKLTDDASLAVITTLLDLGANYTRQNRVRNIPFPLYSFSYQNPVSIDEDFSIPL